MADTDVLVVGAGPAGWAAAAACARTGLDVHLLAPQPRARWQQTYGAWRDELAAAGLAVVAAREWDTVLVRTTGAELRPLPRTYCLVDNDVLQARLMDAAPSATVHSGRATALESRRDHVAVDTAEGQHVTARVVIDATGYPSALRQRDPVAVARQTAYGIVATFDRPPIPEGSMCLMDLDARPFAPSEPATFLYAMDLGGGRWFVEETSLAARPPVRIDLLRRRLERRLAARDCHPREVLGTERVAFAMGAPLPPDGPAVAFGAAAAMVHPATGYQVAAMLQVAPVLAAALGRALAARGTAAGVARAGHRAVWPRPALRRDALYRLGLEVLLSLDADATQRFFGAFFALPASRWMRYVSRTASPAELRGTMLRLMLSLPPDLRRTVLRTATTPAALRLLTRSVAPSVFSP